MTRVIMHIDMNAFFASVEQAANPELLGKPIAVIGSSARTVILTASYEARKYGVKTGMTTFQGKKQCRRLIFVVADNRKYTRISADIVAMMLDYTPLVEVFSIDEAFLDVTNSLKYIYGAPERIAYSIKARIKESFGITCSIGIAPNKLLAKLAGEMQKPDGLTIIRPEEIERLMEKLPIRDLCGVGKRTERCLNELGIHTCGQLGLFPVKILRQKFGIIGERLSQMGKGVDDNPVVPAEEDDEVKSVGHSMTLKQDVSLRVEILKYLLQLSEMVGRRARRYGVSGRTVSLYIRLADYYTSFSKQKSLQKYINGSDEIYKVVISILDTIELTQPVRLLGVRISNLQYNSEQLSLFEEERSKALLARAMDTINDRFGEFSISFAGLPTDRKKGCHVISPAWRPEGIRNINVL